MQMSNRISSFQASPIRRLVPYSRDAENKGIHVIHLNIGQPDIKTPKEALDAIRSYDKDIIEYGISEGELFLRRGLVNYYRKYGLKISPEDIMITTGGSEAIQFVFMTLCDPYDEFIIPEPYYTNVATFANIAMVTLRPVTSSSDDNFALPSIGEFEKRINKKTMGIMLCSPNNPTGIVYSLDDIAELADCNEGITVVDEAYSDFSEDFRSAVSLIESNKRVVVMRTLSKAWGLAGARIGIMAADPEIIAVFNKAKAPYNVSRLGQDAAIGALVNIEAEKAVVEEIRRERKRLGAFLLLLPYIRWVIPSEANFILAGVDDPGRFCSYLASCGIVVRNRSSEPLLSGGVRITIGSEEENMKLEEALVGYSKMQEEGPVCR